MNKHTDLKVISGGDQKAALESELLNAVFLVKPISTARADEIHGALSPKGELSIVSNDATDLHPPLPETE